MKKIAIFVEGQTELLFMDRLVHELAVSEGLVVELAEASGGSSRARRMKILKRAQPAEGRQCYVLIVNCGGDSMVKSDILERHHGLAAAGFALVLGLRDVYGQFRYEDVPRLRESLRYGLPRRNPVVEIILSVMEIEAWFLAEHTHFQRIARELTPERIARQLRFDPRWDDLERRWHPAQDLDRAYQLGGARYTKQRGNVARTLDCLDFALLLAEVPRRFRDFGRLASLLRAEFSA